MKDKVDLDPTIFTLTSVLVGMLMTGDMSYPEMNAIGNWLVLLGDYLLTYASQKYVIEQKIQRDINYQEKNIQKDNIDFLYDAIIKMKKEIEEIKKRN